ncbi:MAG: TonB-dependent receptor [Thiotrichaceae bacterium]
MYPVNPILRARALSEQILAFSEQILSLSGQILTFGASFPLLLMFSLMPSLLFAEEPAQEVANESIPTALEEIVVTASRTTQTVDQALAATTVITRKEIEISQATTIIDVLRKYATGVDVTIRGGLGKDSSLHMRGTESDHVLVLIDGVRASSTTTGGMAWSLLSADMIERVEIVRGPRSSLYGSDAIGGIVSITTRKGKSGSWHASASAGSFDTQKVSVGTSLGNEKTHYSINASYLDTDGIDARVTNNPDKDGHDNTGVNMQLQHQFTDKTDISFSALYAEGENEYDDFGDATRSSYNSFLQKNLGLTLNTEFTSFWDSSLSLGEYRDESETFDSFPGFFNTKRQQINWQNDFSWDTQSQLTVGIDHQRDQIDSITAYTENSRTNTGIFTEYQGSIGAHDLQLSLRTDDNEAFGTHTTGGIAVGRDLGTKSRLTASYGTAFKAPVFNELYFPNFGNADLNPEESNTFEIGLRTTIGKGRLNANIFRTQVSDLIAAVLIDPVTFSFQAQNVDKARIDGLELDYSQSINNLQLNTNLTLLNPKDVSTGNTLESRVKQTLKVNLDRDFGKFAIGGTLLAQGKRAKGTFSNVVPGYATADLRTRYQLSKHLQLKAEINNLLDKEYQTKDGFNMPDRNVMFTVNYQVE